MQAPPDHPIRIAVIGEGQASGPLAEAAEIIGREVARRGGVLICGGMGGVMEAAARGAATAGGVVVGILPTPTTKEGNPYLTIPLATGLGEARNILVVRSADAVIAVGGGYGTLSEIGFALKLAIPVVGLDTWHLQRPGGAAGDPIARAQTALEAVERAWTAALRRRQAGRAQP